MLRFPHVTMMFIGDRRMLEISFEDVRMSILECRSRMLTRFLRCHLRSFEDACEHPQMSLEDAFRAP